MGKAQFQELLPTFTQVIQQHALRQPRKRAPGGGMKRYGAMHQVLRNKLGRFDDRVALVSAELWNHHLTTQACNPS
jgi:hypothetical protein